MLANILLSVFFLLMLTRAFITEGVMLLVVQLGSWGLQIAALVLLFWGFIRPSMIKGAKK
jgi:hypothetical protein